MTIRAARPAPAQRLQILAEFRHQLRRFLHFSEDAAQRVGLQPQQHQLLLQIAGAPDGVPATIGYAAQQLGLRHNTVVGLCDRCETGGLVLRVPAEGDRRRVLMQLTARGRELLEDLSIAHARELNELAPELIRTLTRLKSLNRKAAPAASRRRA
jgi:DNA-binding MarR family transcriptional regulator